MDDHCIDCGKCVQVCPQGIDIRDGFQLECINCSRCIDACEDVMGHLDKPSFIRYSTVAADEGRKTRWLRGRTVVYASLLLGLTSVLTYRVVTHENLEVTVNRTPGSLFQQDGDGFVRNTFLVRVVNNDPLSAHTYTLHVEGLDDPQVTVAPDLVLQPMEDRTVPLIVRMPAGATDRTAEFSVRVVNGEQTVAVDATFKAPPRAGGEG